MSKINRQDTDSDNPNLYPHKRGELAKQILLMVAAGLFIPAAFAFPKLPSVLLPLIKSFSKKLRTQNYAIAKSITYLKRRRLVSVVEKDGQQILMLSEYGKKRVLQFDLDKIIIKKPKKWDGWWRLVIFDIPEECKQGREALREKLKKLGFFQLQKSCFVYPYECKDEIDFITEIFDISSYINFIMAKSIEGEEQLKKYFGID